MATDAQGALKEWSDPGEESERIARWRLEQFTLIVGSPEAAELLAGSEADLGLARDLSRKGATPAQILRILY